MKSRYGFVLRQLRERVLASEIAAETCLEEILLTQEDLLDYARRGGYVMRKFALEDIAAPYDAHARLAAR